MKLQSDEVVTIATIATVASIATLVLAEISGNEIASPALRDIREDVTLAIKKRVENS